MLHVRLIVPPDLTAVVLEMLRRAPEVTNLWHLPGAASKPAGDLVSCDVAKEEASTLLGELLSVGQAAGAAAHLAINLTAIVASGLAVLTATRRRQLRRRR